MKLGAQTSGYSRVKKVLSFGEAGAKLARALAEINPGLCRIAPRWAFSDC